MGLNKTCYTAIAMAKEDEAQSRSLLRDAETLASGVLDYCFVGNAWMKAVGDKNEAQRLFNLAKELAENSHHFATLGHYRIKTFGDEEEARRLFDRAEALATSCGEIVNLADNHYDTFHDSNYAAELIGRAQGMADDLRQVGEIICLLAKIGKSEASLELIRRSGESSMDTQSWYQGDILLFILDILNIRNVFLFRLSESLTDSDDSTDPSIDELQEAANVMWRPWKDAASETLRKRESSHQDTKETRSAILRAWLALGDKENAFRYLEVLGSRSDGYGKSAEYRSELASMWSELGEPARAERSLVETENVMRQFSEFVAVAKTWLGLGRNDDARRIISRAEATFTTGAMLAQIAALWTELFGDESNRSRTIRLAEQNATTAEDWLAIADVQQKSGESSEKIRQSLMRAEGANPQFSTLLSIGRDYHRLLNMDSESSNVLRVLEKRCGSANDWLSVAYAWQDLSDHTADVQRCLGQAGRTATAPGTHEITAHHVASSLINAGQTEAGADLIRSLETNLHSASDWVSMAARWFSFSKDESRRCLAKAESLAAAPYDWIRIAEFYWKHIGDDSSAQRCIEVSMIAFCARLKAQSSTDFGVSILSAAKDIAQMIKNVSGDEQPARRFLREVESECVEPGHWLKIGEAWKDAIADPLDVERCIRRAAEASRTTMDWLEVATKGWRDLLGRDDEAQTSLGQAEHLAQSSNDWIVIGEAWFYRRPPYDKDNFRRCLYRAEECHDNGNWDTIAKAWDQHFPDDSDAREHASEARALANSWMKRIKRNHARKIPWSW